MHMQSDILKKRKEGRSEVIDGEREREWERERERGWGSERVGYNLETLNSLHCLWNQKLTLHHYENETQFCGLLSGRWWVCFVHVVRGECITHTDRPGSHGAWLLPVEGVFAPSLTLSLYRFLVLCMKWRHVVGNWETGRVLSWWPQFKQQECAILAVSSSSPLFCLRPTPPLSLFLGPLSLLSLPLSFSLSFLFSSN